MGKVADADKLDGLDAGAFVSVAHSETVVFQRWHRRAAGRENPLRLASSTTCNVCGIGSSPVKTTLTILTG